MHVVTVNNLKGFNFNLSNDSLNFRLVTGTILLLLVISIERPPWLWYGTIKRRRHFLGVYTQAKATLLSKIEWLYKRPTLLVGEIISSGLCKLLDSELYLHRIRIADL